MASEWRNKRKISKSILAEIWSLMSQGRSVQKVKNSFLEEHGMKLIAEKNNCAYQVWRAHLRNMAGEQLMGVQPGQSTLQAV